MGKFLKYGLPALALAMLAAGAYIGLVWAPPEREMGDVQRIMYVHVPAWWMVGLCWTINLTQCLAFLLVDANAPAPEGKRRPWYRALFPGRWQSDAMAEASAEVGMLFALIGMALGAIWGRPTWGVYWTWDPRLTTAAIMIVAYAGYLALRKLVDDPERSATWSAVAGVIAYVNIPIVYFSVKWWNTLHQPQSSPKTVDPAMVFALRWYGFTYLAVMIYFLWHRYRISLAARQEEIALPDALPAPARPSEVAP